MKPIAALSLAALSASLPTSSAHAQQAVLRLPSISLQVALKAADAALVDCRTKGALVAVAVTDRSGVVLALLRDPLAGMHTPDAATRKAWTAASFRNATTALERATGPSTDSNGIRQLPGVAMVGGGLPISAAGQQVGAIGVSGAPSGKLDEACAEVGLAAVRDDLELGQ
ncbi:MAG: heme-binding protein [Pseudomonadota bacterium]|nr:heme-binding protein [Pseudomonadota bacterium]